MTIDWLSAHTCTYIEWCLYTYVHVHVHIHVHVLTDKYQYMIYNYYLTIHKQLTLSFSHGYLYSYYKDTPISQFIMRR